MTFTAKTIASSFVIGSALLLAACTTSNQTEQLSQAEIVEIQELFPEGTILNPTWAETLSAQENFEVWRGSYTDQNLPDSGYRDGNDEPITGDALAEVKKDLSDFNRQIDDRLHRWDDELDAKENFSELARSLSTVSVDSSDIMTPEFDLTDLPKVASPTSS